jgi:hypothetical protein
MPICQRRLHRPLHQNVNYFGFLVISSSLNVVKSEGSDQSTSVVEEGLHQNDVSTVLERSRLSLKNQRIKCVQYLQSNLNEFMQTVDVPSNKVSFKEIDTLLFAENLYFLTFSKFYQNFRILPKTLVLQLKKYYTKYFIHF